MSVNLGRVLLLVLVVLLAAALSACEGTVAGTPALLDPWADAIRRAQLELEEAADFQARLDYYRRASVKIGNRLEVVEKAEPELDIIDKLKAEELPFLGSGWEALNSALERSSPGSGETLAEVSHAVHRAADFRETLGELEALQPVAEAGQDFEDDPGAETLQALADRCATAAPALSRTGEEVAALVADLEKPLDEIDALGAALEETRGNDVPVIANGATELARTVKETRGALEGLHRELTALHSAIKRDLHTMQAIQDVASGVESPTPTSTSAEPAPVAAPQSAGVPVGLLLVVGFIVLIVVLVAVEQRRSISRREEPAEAAPVEPPSPQVEEPAAQVPDDQEAALAPERPAEPWGFLRVVQGEEPGRTYELTAAPVSLGRRRDSDIRLAGRDVSRRHAIIRYGRGSYFIQDQGSMHGTFVNGERVDACPLRDGDRVTIGGAELEFRYAGPTADVDDTDTV